MIICVMGESGSGKTTAMRTLDPKTTMYIDCDKKGLSWKGWAKQYSLANKNYFKSDDQGQILSMLRKVNTDKAFQHIKTVVIDTINGIMVADEMRRSKDKGYDKWLDLACAVYDLIDYGLTVREDLTVIYVAHCQTERDDSGIQWTRIKTSGKKLDKIVLESKFPIVLLAKTIDENHVFETTANLSTAKTPMGLFQNKTIPNDMQAVLTAVKQYNEGE